MTKTNCPICGAKYGNDQLYPYLCNNCGWDDIDEMRDDETGGENASISFNKAKDIVKTGKNLIDGGPMPWNNNING